MTYKKHTKNSKGKTKKNGGTKKSLNRIRIAPSNTTKIPHSERGVFGRIIDTFSTKNTGKSRGNQNTERNRVEPILEDSSPQVGILQAAIEDDAYEKMYKRLKAELLEVISKNEDNIDTLHQSYNAFLQFISHQQGFNTKISDDFRILDNKVGVNENDIGKLTAQIHSTSQKIAPRVKSEVDEYLKNQVQPMIEDEIDNAQDVIAEKAIIAADKYLKDIDVIISDKVIEEIQNARSMSKSQLEEDVELLKKEFAELQKLIKNPTIKRAADTFKKNTRNQAPPPPPPREH
jgi:hypothetical protein